MSHCRCKGSMGRKVALDGEANGGRAVMRGASPSANGAAACFRWDAERGRGRRGWQATVPRRPPEAPRRGPLFRISTAWARRRHSRTSVAGPFPHPSFQMRAAERRDMRRGWLASCAPRVGCVGRSSRRSQMARKWQEITNFGSRACVHFPKCLIGKVQSRSGRRERGRGGGENFRNR